jgi:hypothetical protein
LVHNVLVSLAFDPERSVEELACVDCARSYRLVRGELTWFDAPHAVFIAGCHHHAGTRDVLIDVILGWARDGDDDRVTIGCRVGPVVGEDGPVATVVDAATSYGDDPEWGRKLTRSQALADHRLAEFWDAVDFVLVHDPTIRPHVYGID